MDEQTFRLIRDYLREMARGTGEILRVFEAVEPFATPAGEHAAWDVFLGEHPELARREPLDLCDDEQVVAAVAAAHREWLEAHPQTTTEGVWARTVTLVLLGQSAADLTPPELRPTQGDVIRVGRRLGELARNGRLRRTNRTWETPCYAVSAERRRPA